MHGVDMYTGSQNTHKQIKQKKNLLKIVKGVVIGYWHGEKETRAEKNKTSFTPINPCVSIRAENCVQSEHQDWEHSVAFELRGPGDVPWRCAVWWQTQCEVCILCWEPRLQGNPMMSHGWVLPETPQMHYVFALELIFDHGSFGNLCNAVTFHDFHTES